MVGSLFEQINYKKRHLDNQGITNMNRVLDNKKLLLILLAVITGLWLCF